jgi:hypothetical protein
MSPAALTARLRRVAALSNLGTERRLEAKVDYSPAGVTLRLAQVAALHRLCMALGRRPKPDLGT